MTQRLSEEVVNWKWWTDCMEEDWRTRKGLKTGGVWLGTITSGEHLWRRWNLPWDEATGKLWKSVNLLAHITLKHARRDKRPIQFFNRFSYGLRTLISIFILSLDYPQTTFRVWIIILEWESLLVFWWFHQRKYGLLLNVSKWREKRLINLPSDSWIEGMIVLRLEDLK